MGSHKGRASPPGLWATMGMAFVLLGWACYNGVLARRPRAVMGGGTAMNVKIISVGGTIDKVYFDRLSEYQVGGPSIRGILENLVLNFDYEVVSLTRKDSLDMTAEDRERVYQAVAQDPDRLILITHGTDTMIDTARALLGIKGKVVLLTGAMEPAGFKTSDAVFNVGCAIGAIQCLEDGVYIAVNGRIYRPNQIRKERPEGRFVEMADGPESLGQ